MATDKARHAFGNSSGVQAALDAGTIDAYDILFLDGDSNPMLGWVDKNGIARYVIDKTQIVRVTELPTADGDENVVYVYNNVGYVWDSANSKCVSLAQSADLTALETQVSNLETQMGTKVDETKVTEMIKAYSENVVEIVEF